MVRVLCSRGCCARIASLCWYSLLFQNLQKITLLMLCHAYCKCCSGFEMHVATLIERQYQKKWSGMHSQTSLPVGQLWRERRSSAWIWSLSCFAMQPPDRSWICSWWPSQVCVCVLNRNTPTSWTFEKIKLYFAQSSALKCWWGCLRFCPYFAGTSWLVSLPISCCCRVSWGCLGWASQAAAIASHYFFTIWIWQTNYSVSPEVRSLWFTSSRCAVHHTCGMSYTVLLVR